MAKTKKKSETNKKDKIRDVSKVVETTQKSTEKTKNRKAEKTQLKERKSTQIKDNPKKTIAKQETAKNKDSNKKTMTNNVPKKGTKKTDEKKLAIKKDEKSTDFIKEKETPKTITISKKKEQTTEIKSTSKVRTKSSTKKDSQSKDVTKKTKRVSKSNKNDTYDVKSSADNQTVKTPKVYYSDEDLELFRNRIMEARKEAVEELTMLRERLEDLTDYDFAEESMIYSMHMAEQGSEAFEKEKTYAQIQRINEYLKKLDDALLRIKNKTYGICRICGCLIAKERLLAVPITTLSASYKIQKKCPEDGIDRVEPVKN